MSIELTASDIAIYLGVIDSEFQHIDVYACI